METMNYRIKLAREKLGMKQNELAEKIGVSPQAVNLWEKEGEGGTAPRGKRLIQIAQALQVDPVWLQFGGDANATTPPLESSVGIAEEIDVDNDEDYVSIDRYDLKLSAGTGNFTWIINAKDPLVFRKSWFKKKGLNPNSCKAMYVRGDSMSTALEDWDTVLIDTDDTEIIAGEIYAVVYNGRQYIKYIDIRGDGIDLVSANEKYKPISIPDSDADKFQVLGRKVWRGG